MATSDNISSRSGFGWLPKLILWGLVITFTYLYLSSIDRERNPSFTEVVDSINKLSPLPITPLPSAKPAVTPNASPQTAEISATAGAANETAPAVTAPQPAIATVTATPAQTPQTTSPARVEILANQPPAPAPATETQPQTMLARPPHAPIMTPQAPTAMTSAPSPVTAPASAQTAHPVQPMAAAPFDPNLIAWQQDRIQAQYEAQYDAMRREAEARMRQYWNNAPPPPAAPPYGYPGYLPGYAPGYAPSFYPPPN